MPYSFLFLTVPMEAKQPICNWNYCFPLWKVCEFIWPLFYFVPSAIIYNYCRSFLVSRSKDAQVWEDSPETYMKWLLGIQRKGCHEWFCVEEKEVNSITWRILPHFDFTNTLPGEKQDTSLRVHLSTWTLLFWWGLWLWSGSSDSWNTLWFALQSSGGRCKLDSFLMKLDWKIRSRIAPNMLLLLLGTSPANNPKLNSWNS